MQNLELEVKKHAGEVEWSKELDTQLTDLANATSYDFAQVAADLSNSTGTTITEAATRIRFTEIELGQNKSVLPAIAWNAAQDALLMKLVPELMYDFDAVAAEIQRSASPDDSSGSCHITGDVVRCRFVELDEA